MQARSLRREFDDISKGKDANSEETNLDRGHGDLPAGVWAGRGGLWF